MKHNNPNMYLRAMVIQHYGNVAGMGAQQAFGNKVGRNQSIVSKVVNGHMKLKSPERRKWAKALNGNQPKPL